MDKGLALTNAGRHVEGAVCYCAALESFRREWANGSSKAGMLAALTLYNIGQSFKGPGALEEEIRHYDEALEIYRQLAAKPGGVGSKEAATVWTAKSRVLLVLGRFEESAAAAQRAVEILEPLVAEKGRDYLKLDLSLALLRQGKALESLQRPWDASRCFQRSTELVQEVKRGYDAGRETSNDE